MRSIIIRQVQTLSKSLCPTGKKCKTCNCTLAERMERSGFVPSTKDEDFLQKNGFRSRKCDIDTSDHQTSFSKDPDISLVIDRSNPAK